MNRALIPLLIVAVVALGLWGREQMTRAQSSGVSKATQTPPKQVVGGNAAGATPLSSPTPTNSFQHTATVTEDTNSLKKTNPKASLSQMTYFLLAAARGHKNFDRIVLDLKKSGQKPTVTRDSNPTTGDMYIIRTQSPLPGTRYFHAQYFTDENNKKFVQHMSFEFQPGPTSMSDAVQTAMRNFALGEPTFRKADYAQWKLDEDYILWIKKKSAKDLKDDPFKAYDPKTDVGTVQMTVELEIHGEGDKSHEH